MPEFDELVRIYRETRPAAGLEAAIAVGGAVLDGFFDGDVDQWRTGTGTQTVRALALRSGLGLSPSTLYRFVAIAAMCRALGRTRFDHLGPSHLRQLLPLDPADQASLIERAEEERWTVRQIQEEVRTIASPARSRRGAPAFVRGLAHLRKWVRLRGHLTGLDRLDALHLEHLTRLQQLVATCGSELARIDQALEGELRAREDRRRPRKRAVGAEDRAVDADRGDREEAS
jgi:hypothetical protein